MPAGLTIFSIVIAEAPGALVHERFQRFVRNQVAARLACRMHMAHLGQEDEEVLRCQAGKPEDGATEVHEAVGRKGVLRKP